MSDTATPVAVDPVKQFSVFLPNRVGRLYDLASLLAKKNIHVMAMTTLDTTDCAIDRLIVDDPDQARELLVKNDFAFTECEVLVVEFADESHLKGVLAALMEVEVNIHYIYSFLYRPGGKLAVAMSLEDSDLATQSLNTHGYRVLTQRDISR